MKKTYLTPFNQRQFMIKDNFELFYYEDINTNNVQKHTHNYYEFYFFVDGNISMFIKEKPHQLKQGDVILIPPHISHYIVNHDQNIPYRRFVLWIDSKYYKNLMDKSQEFKFIVNHTKENNHYVYSNDLIKFNSFQTKLFNIIEEISTHNFGKEQKIILSLYDLILDLNRMAYDLNHPSMQHVSLNLHDNIISYIETNIEDDLSLNDIAENFYVSKYHIAHIFKQKYGISVHKFITKRRLEMCKNAIMNGLNITDTFNKYGFKDYSSFYRAFKKEFGLSPKEYKELHK